MRLRRRKRLVTGDAKRDVIVFVKLSNVAVDVTKVLGATHAGKAQPRGHVVDDVSTLAAQLRGSLGPEVDQVGGHVARETGNGAAEYQRASGRHESIARSYFNI